jgi:hypothetical protein
MIIGFRNVIPLDGKMENTVSVVSTVKIDRWLNIIERYHVYIRKNECVQLNDDALLPNPLVEWAV